MPESAINNTRNVVMLGHTGSGKTSLTDAILHKAGLNDRLGLVASGTSMADWTDDEKERGITLWAKPFHVCYTTSEGQSLDLTLMDTPGYLDLQGQATAAARVADAALIVVDAVAGIEVGSLLAWRLCEKNDLPCGVVITGLDKENANFESALAAVQKAWGRACVPVELPTKDRGAVIDILASARIPDEIKADADKALGILEEDAAEEDDTLLEKYLSGEHLSRDELTGGLRVAFRRRHLVPVFETEALKGVGIGVLLDELFRLFPSPVDRTAHDEGGNAIDPGADAPFCGLLWRGVNDPHVGQLYFLRVFGGTLRADSEVLNSSRNHKERIGAIHRYNGRKEEPVTVATAGQIVALTKLKSSGINETLCATGSAVHLPRIIFPAPVMSAAVITDKAGEDDKVSSALHRIVEEDPTLHLDRNAETHELVLSGMGDMHLEIAVSRMRRRNGPEVKLAMPRIAYKEAVTMRADGHYRHRKQSGGRGQYAEVYLKVEPRDPEDDVWFVNEITGGAIPRNFMPAVEKGVLEGLGRGVLAGFPILHARVRVVDGTFHEVDSSEVAFRIAAARALTEGAAKAGPVLLEPVMHLRISVPESFLGDITGDLNHRRGRILAMDTESGVQVITAEAPQAELFRYAADLRRMTHGQGSFEALFDRYDMVPAHISRKLVDSAVKQQHEDE